MEASSGGVCQSTSCWKEPLIDSQQKNSALLVLSVFTTAQRVLLQQIRRTRQLLLCITRKRRLCLKSWILTFRSVAVIAAFRQWQQRTSFVLAMTLLQSHGNTINFAHTFRDAQREKQSSHFQGKVRDLVALLGLQFEPPFFASYARRTVSKQG